MPLYDILISNPPYIRSAEIEELMEELKSIRQKMYIASAAILSISSFFLIAMLLR